MLHKFFEIIGILVLVFIGLIILSKLIIIVWHKVKYRTWIYQVFEYRSLVRKFKEFKLNDFRDTEDITINWNLVKYQMAKFEGKVKGHEYRKRNLFKKKCIAIYDAMLKSEGHQEYIIKYCS
jgi:hypothetical protein